MWVGLTDNVGVPGAFKISITSFCGLRYGSAPKTAQADKEIANKDLVTDFIEVTKILWKPAAEVNDGQGPAL